MILQIQIKTTCHESYIIQNNYAKLDFLWACLQIIPYQFACCMQQTSNYSQLAKWKKVNSFYVTAMKFMGQKQSIQKNPIILEKLQLLWICEIWGNFLKNLHFANNSLILSKFESEKSFAHMILILM